MQDYQKTLSDTDSMDTSPCQQTQPGEGPTPIQVAVQELFNKKKLRNTQKEPETSTEKEPKKVTITEPQEEEFTEVKPKAKRPKTTTDNQRPLIGI